MWDKEVHGFKFYTICSIMFSITGPCAMNSQSIVLFYGKFLKYYDIVMYVLGQIA